MREPLKTGVVIAGTDTGVGKTVLSALLTLALDADYWKPVQSGLEEETDSDVVRRLAGLPADRVHREAYRLRRPLSPDQSAAADGIVIEPDRLQPPISMRPLVIELAGGLLVPYSDTHLQIDVVRRFDRPLILAARTGLGTLNHTLLSIEALRSRDLPCLGVVLIGPVHPGNVRTLARWSPVPLIGWIPLLEHLNARVLREAYDSHFTPFEEWTIARWS